MNDRGCKAGTERYPCLTAPVKGYDRCAYHGGPAQYKINAERRLGRLIERRTRQRREVELKLKKARAVVTTLEAELAAIVIPDA